LTFKCRRCGRVLKAPESQELGYGHTCAIKAGVIVEKISNIKKSKNMSIFDFDLET